jgi:acetyl esterase/lipase
LRRIDMSHFHPELRRAAFWIPRLSFGPRLTRLANRLQRAGKPPRPPEIDGVTIRDEIVAGGNGQPMRVRLYLPNGAVGSRAAMLWMHGGGMIIGVPEQDEAQNVELCRDYGLVVAAVAYRLSPQHPYPAPLEDCYAALRWLHSHANALQISTDRLAVGGNSAGAGLAAGLALLAHDRAEFSVAFQLLIYPMLDDRTAVRTDVDERRLRLWTTKSNRFGWRSYLGREPGGEGVPVYAAPARRDDLSGLPPAWIGVGTCDLFHDEDVSYARRLSAAGVPCTLKVVEGAFHGFEIAGRGAAIVRDFRCSYVTALSDGLQLTRPAETNAA